MNSDALTIGDQPEQKFVPAVELGVGVDQMLDGGVYHPAQASALWCCVPVVATQHLALQAPQVDGVNQFALVCEADSSTDELGCMRAYESGGLVLLEVPDQEG